MLHDYELSDCDFLVNCRSSATDAPSCATRIFTARHVDAGFMSLSVDSAPKKGNTARMVLRVVIKQAWTSPSTVNLPTPDFAPVTLPVRVNSRRSFEVHLPEGYDQPASAFLTPANRTGSMLKGRRGSGMIAFKDVGEEIGEAEEAERLLLTMDSKPSTQMSRSDVGKSDEGAGSDLGGSEPGSLKERSEDAMGDAESVGSGVSALEPCWFR